MLRENSDIRKDILETLDKIFPDDVIEMWGGIEESYLGDVYEELSDKLSAIETATLEYERDWQGNDPRYDNDGEFPAWRFEEEDPDEPLDMGDIDSSYHVFFLGLKGEQFRFDTEGETTDEDGKWVKVNCTGTFGCCVGISLLAPFAMIVPATMNN